MPDPSNFRPVSKAALRRALEGEDARVSDLKGAVVELSSRTEFVREIIRLWRESQARFLTIGRYLVQARSKLPHGEYQTMVERDLPFGIHVAYQLRAVAEAIDGGRFSEVELPPNYSVVYQVMTLTESELQVARERGIIRPELTRREIAEFKRNIRVTSNRRTALERRRKQILEQQVRLAEELQRIEEELGVSEVEPSGACH